MLHKWKTITKEKSRDAGLGLSLLMLILFFKINSYLFLISMGLFAFVALLHPKFLKLFAFIGLNVGSLVGALLSNTALICIFFFVITPIRVMFFFTNTDSLLVRKWGMKNESYFYLRNKQFEKEEFERLF